MADVYARAFSSLRDRQVDKLTKRQADALIAQVTGQDGLKDLTLTRSVAPDGTVHEAWQIDSPADAKLFRQIHRSPSSAPGDDPLADGLAAPPRRRTPPAKPAVPAMQLGEARDQWLASLKGNHLPKTWTIKKTAIEALVRFLGPKTALASIRRPDLARWYHAMRDAGSSTPTLTNKQSYIGGRGGFFDWAINSGYYPNGDNPAAGHVTYSVREKRNRRKLGFKAFDERQVQVLFSPVAIETMPAAARWAALIGLHTGARASEVGQLRTADIFVEDGILCFRVTDEGEHQRVKTDVSLRTIPVHPDLLALGFAEWVEQLRAAGDDRLFPQAKADAKNGPGQWITKAFGRHLEGLSGDWPPGKRGFHSLRKTVIQRLQGAGVVSELRAQLAGHELDDEHHAVYSRAFTVREKLEGVGGLSPGLRALDHGLNLVALRAILEKGTAPSRHRSAKNPR